MISKASYQDILVKCQNVRCVAISKKRSVSEMLALYEFGQRDFGENYLQELMLKIELLKKHEITWHYTGRIQSNKCQDIANLVDWVHSINSERQLELFSQYRLPEKPALKCLLQVIPDGYKHDYALSFLQAEKLIKQKPNIEVSGIMVMPCLGESQQALTDIFAKAYSFAVNNWELPSISMGMSQDFELAIANGANIVRLGQKLFSK